RRVDTGHRRGWYRGQREAHRVLNDMAGLRYEIRISARVRSTRARLVCSGCRWPEAEPRSARHDERASLVKGQAARIVELGARLVYLRAAQFLPFGRAAATMADRCALRVSTGTVAAAVAEAAGRLGPFTDRVRLLLRGSAVLGADETPAWVDGGWKYVHVACT